MHYSILLWVKRYVVKRSWKKLTNRSHRSFFYWNISHYWFFLCHFCVHMENRNINYHEHTDLSHHQSPPISSPAQLPSLCFSSPLQLGVQMELDLSLEEQLPQLAVRGFAHGFGLHAHLVLVRRKLIRAGLLVPQVEKATRRRANHHQLAVEVLPVQVHVLQPPTFNVSVKTPWEEVWTYVVRVRRCI